MKSHCPVSPVANAKNCDGAKISCALLPAAHRFSSANVLATTRKIVVKKSPTLKPRGQEKFKCTNKLMTAILKAKIVGPWSTISLKQCLAIMLFKTMQRPVKLFYPDGAVRLNDHRSRGDLLLF